MWTRSVCFAGIRCGTKTCASLLFCTAAFFSPGTIFFLSFFLFSLCGNLRFPDSSHAWRELTYSVHVCIITCVYVANSVHVCIISVLLCAFSLANIQCTCVYYYVFSVVNIQCTCVFYVANNVTCTVRVYYQLCVYVVNIHCTCVYIMCIWCCKNRCTCVYYVANISTVYYSVHYQLCLCG